MKLVSMGDMAQTWALRRQNVSLNSEMLRLTQELSSGETTNIAQHLNGDLRYLSDVEHRGRTAQAYETAVSAAGGFAGAMQAALETIQTGTETLGADLLIGAGGTQGTRQALAHSAEDCFRAEHQLRRAVFVCRGCDRQRRAGTRAGNPVRIAECRGGRSHVRWDRGRSKGLVCRARWICSYGLSGINGKPVPVSIGGTRHDPSGFAGRCAGTA
ncbi:hypothetical protein SAMN06265173_11853 [Thalassovita litoralis]|uniref:Flagellin N-terminal domain-containing protein n=1 Tax=Thalassovita litoralis TaxID=1010611 RepID=A0A521EQM5_9RHOB|nr:hypothetical protein SAMN06265173_11853 [Thalassovita litoralis]